MSISMNQFSQIFLFYCIILLYGEEIKDVLIEKEEVKLYLQFYSHGDSFLHTVGEDFASSSSAMSFPCIQYIEDR